MPAGKYWTTEEDRFLTEKANILTSNDIGDLLSRSSKSVRRRAETLGVSLTGYKRREYKQYSLHTDFFVKLNPVSAYWLGVIWSDGSLTDYGIRIAISSKDGDWLQALVSDIGSSSSLTQITGRNAIGLGLYSTKLVEALLYYGLEVGDRTQKNLIPQNIPNVLLHHFVRGLFDGDGNFTYYGKDGCYSCVCITNTHTLCNWIWDITKKQIGVRGGVYRRKTGNVSDWKVGGRNQVLAFADWLYCDAERFLMRKRNKFQEYCKASKVAEERRPAELAVSLA